MDQSLQEQVTRLEEIASNCCRRGLDQILWKKFFTGRVSDIGKGYQVKRWNCRLWECSKASECDRWGYALGVDLAVLG